MEVSLLFSGLLFHEKLESMALERISAEFGHIIVESTTIPFDFTSYYDAEMGRGLLRKWVLFDTEIEQGSITKIKRKAMNTEQKLSVEDRRWVNIDPGYVTLSKVVLPTTKDCSHRIYLGDGIYAEITLMYSNGAWRPQDWTYRDYRSPSAMEFFNKCRKVILARRTL